MSNATTNPSDASSFDVHWWVLALIAAVIVGVLWKWNHFQEKKRDQETWVSNSYIMQLEVAIGQYQQIYSYLPYTLERGTGSDLVISGTAKYDKLMATLSAADATLNPRGIQFIELDADDAYVDAWGNDFIVALDLEYDDTVTHPDVGTIKRTIVIWSPGPDGKWEPPASDTTLPTNRDNILSWERN